MTEMDKLDAMLTQLGIEHTYGRRFPQWMNWYRKSLLYSKTKTGERRLWSMMAKCEHGMLSADMVRMVMNKA